MQQRVVSCRNTDIIFLGRSGKGMQLKLIENRNIENITITIEYREKDEQINKLIDFYFIFF